MDAAQLERCKGMMEQILADMRKLAVDLENTVLLRAVNQQPVRELPPPAS